VCRAAGRLEMWAEKPSKNSNAANHHMVGSSNMRIEILRELPKGSMVVLQRKEFEALFRDSDPRRRADNIARLNGCDLTLDEKSGVARFTKVECPAPWRRETAWFGHGY
jgi:hypothetical protein